MMMIMIIMKSQETKNFKGTRKRPLLETMARKVMVDFKFDGLYTYVSIESLLKYG